MIHFTGSTTVGRRIAQAAARPAQEGLAGTGRQQRAAGARRRRPRPGDDDRRLVGLPLPGPDVHHRRAPHRAPGMADAYVGGLAARAEAITVGDRYAGGRARPDDQRETAGAGRQMLADAVAAGARVVASGAADGPYFRPTVVADVSPPAGCGPRRSRPSRRCWWWTTTTRRSKSPTTPPTAWSDSVLTGDTAPGHRAGPPAARRDGARQRRDPAGRGARAVRRDGRSGLGGRSGGDSNLEEFTERRWLTVSAGPGALPVLTSGPPAPGPGQTSPRQAGT